MDLQRKELMIKEMRDKVKTTFIDLKNIISIEGLNSGKGQGYT